jgi:hypothetical protein
LESHGVVSTEHNMGLLEEVRNSNRIPDCSILEIKEIAHNSQHHFVTKLVWKGDTCFVHTITSFPSHDVTCNTRIKNDLWTTLVTGSSSDNYWLERVATPASPTHKHTCPLCGLLGDNLVVKFYCTNEECRNYHP